MIEMDRCIYDQAYIDNQKEMTDNDLEKGLYDNCEVP